MRSRRTSLIWILLAAAAMLIIVAVVSVGLYLILRQESLEGVAWQDPVAAVMPEGVTTELSLWPLAGALESETIDRAIESGDLETAYAVLVFDLSLSDARRIGRLELLGERFVGAENGERAALCYQQIYDIAVLSPRLSAPARAEAFLSSGRGWALAGYPDMALNAYDQVYAMASQSPYLQMANRRHLLERLESAYHELGDDERAGLCAQQIAELQRGESGPPTVVDASMDLPIVGEPISTTEVGELEEVRRQAAYALLEALSEADEPSPDLVANLAEALKAEDAAKLDLYREELEGATQLSARINVQWHTIRWLTVKYQVATRGLGLSVVSEWEEQVPDIQSELSKAYEGLFFDYEDLVTALPEASLIGPGSYRVRRSVALAGRLGQYPNYGEQQMADKVSDAAANLIATGSQDQLYVDWLSEEGGLRFVLSPADGYGQPTQSP
jgi:hypothetical protein